MICPKCGNPADLKKEDLLSLCSMCGVVKVLREDELVEDFINMLKRAIDENIGRGGELILSVADDPDYVPDELIKKVINIYKSRYQSDLIISLISLEGTGRKVFVWTKERFCSDF